MRNVNDFSYYMLPFGNPNLLGDWLNVKNNQSSFVEIVALSKKYFPDVGIIDALAFLAEARATAVPLADTQVSLYDPVPMRLFRLKNRERAQLLVESTSRPTLQALLAAWSEQLHALKAPRELRWHLDVDPLEF